MTNQVIVLATRDRDVTDAVLSSAAAVQVDVEVVETGAAPARPPELLLVGADLASDVARADWWDGLSPVLVGFDAVELGRWSMSMDARVIVLPDGGRWLGALLAGESPGEHGMTLAVLGGSGGVGASTLALGVASAAARRGESAVVVDLDPIGGGLDLLCGAERVSGWRWPQLASARGQTADLAGYLPRVDGVDVVSMARLGAPPGVEARSAVVASLRRTHAVVVLDPGRGMFAGDVDCDAAVLISCRRVAGVAAARERARGWNVAGVVVRGGGSVKPDEVGRAVSAPVWGSIPDDAALATGAEAGMPPSLAGRRPWQKACEKLWLQAEGIRR